MEAGYCLIKTMTWLFALFRDGIEIVYELIICSFFVLITKV